ncbi:MAG: ribonuclease HII [Anaerolineae bacterium]|nr:ribonuclease HII [Anaerolineae bacterium]
MALVRPGRCIPTLREELALLKSGHTAIAGLDEAGRGAWAGPVYAGAVVLPIDNPDLAALLDGVRDSKQLSPQRREALLPVIQEVAQASGIGWVDADEIDALGIVRATELAMQRALDDLEIHVDALLIDFIRLPGVDLPQRCLPKADIHCVSVAAASIVAKVSRDHVMAAMDKRFPGYDFASHKGYGTPAHQAALAQLGPSPIHRKTWRPIRSMLGE